MYLNKVFIFGNLTRDPELRALPSGMGVCSFSVATNRVFKDRNGNKQEQTDFHNVVVFGRQADGIATHLKKGSTVLVEGHLQTRSWEGKDGEKKYRTEIIAESVKFGPRPASQVVPEAEEVALQSSGINYTKDDVNPDDIPF